MKNKVLLSLSAMFLGIALWAQSIPGPIHAAYKSSASAFLTGAEWMPFPKYSDREGWEKLMTEELRSFYINRGEKQLDYQYKTIPISTFLCFYTTGDKQAMRKIEKANRSAFVNFMMAELAEGKGRFLPQIADGLWYYGTAYHWSHSNQCHGHLPQYENEKVASDRKFRNRDGS